MNFLIQNLQVSTTIRRTLVSTSLSVDIDFVFLLLTKHCFVCRIPLRRPDFGVVLKQLAGLLRAFLRSVMPTSKKLVNINSFHYSSHCCSNHVSDLPFIHSVY